MAIKILEHCPACGACLKVCPAKALTIVGGKLTVTENCLECGLCMRQCPVSQLELPKSSPAPSPGGIEKGQRSKSVQKISQERRVKTNA